MSADALLSRLQKVRRTGDGRWSACCPAHADRTPSLSIRELADGRVLLHCHGGCDVENVLAAVGLDFNDLYPDKPIADSMPREKRPFMPADLFDLVRVETGVVAVVAGDMLRDRAIAPEDYERLAKAVERLEGAARWAYGR